MASRNSWRVFFSAFCDRACPLTSPSSQSPFLDLTESDIFKAVTTDLLHQVRTFASPVDGDEGLCRSDPSTCIRSTAASGATTSSRSSSSRSRVARTLENLVAR